MQLTKELKERVDGLHDLQQQQLPEEEMAAIVHQVVPVEAGTPTPMDTDAAPQSTMGPGRSAAEGQVPTIFLADTEEEELEEDVVAMDESEQAEPGPADEDDGVFDADRERWLIVSLTIHHDSQVRSVRSRNGSVVVLAASQSQDLVPVLHHHE